jgi:diacylglycerol kinase family enzyme
MAKIGVIINKNGGSAVEPNMVEIEQILHRRGADYEIAVVAGEEISSTARRMAGQGFEIIAAGGGDGTVNSVAAEVVSSSAALGVLPLGTLNHFARDLGISTDIKQATELLVKGQTSQLDYATVNEHLFLNNSGVGLYPHLVRRRQIDEPRMGKWPAALLSAWRLAKRPFTCLDLQIVCGKVKRNVRTPFIFIGNNDYRIDAMGLNNRERLDEGCLVVYAHNGGNRFRLALNGLLVTAGFSRHLDWVTLRGNTVTVTGQSASLDVTRDGEIITLSLPLEYRVHAGKLKVVAP